MNEIQLSYLITTRNKLPYLKDRITHIIEHKQLDEEIIVADAGSTDGTKEFLNELKQAGKIEYFISESDKGESHGLNKLELVARGTLMTIVTDDDAFYFPAIQESKKFMLEHPEIDILGTEGGFKNQYIQTPVRPLTYESNYRKWMKNHTPFSFCGLGIMLRKTALPILGLWDTSFRRADAEFSLRVTAGGARIAWYTGYSFVNISNPQSTSIMHMKKIKNETDRLNQFYFGKTPTFFLIERYGVLKNKIKSVLHNKNTSNIREEWSNLAKIADEWLLQINKEKKAEFIWDK